MLQQLARDFSRSEIAPVAEHYDRTAEFPLPVIEGAAGGLIGTNIPLDYGGGGASLVEEGAGMRGTGVGMHRHQHHDHDQ
ncbi:MAG: acyl-CoA dehydrogenase family protein [Anaerolineae bacterium]